MAYFDDYNEFAFHSMEESLIMAEKCINTPKGKVVDSCHGMAAVILIASVMDTIGTFYRNGYFQMITANDVINGNNGSHLGGVKQHFRQYHKQFLSSNKLISETEFLQKFFPYARCRATHNSVLGPDVELTLDSTKNRDIFTHGQNKRLCVHLIELLYSVREALKQTKIVAKYTPSAITEGMYTGTSIHNKNKIVSGKKKR